MSIIDELHNYADNDKHLVNGSLTAIAKKFDLSRERIRQIAKINNFVMPHDTENKYLFLICENCGKRFKNEYSKKYCSVECSRTARQKKYWTDINCKQCGKKFKVYKKDLKNRGRYFCSKTCQGKFIGKEYGFATQPAKQRKYKSIEQVRKDFPDDFTTIEFAKKYKYKSDIGAWSAIKNLKIRGLVVNGRIRGLYKTKKEEAII